ncbi:MAG: DUF305 domain-containing protein [Mycobacteriaceae bacterium]
MRTRFALPAVAIVTTLGVALAGCGSDTTGPSASTSSGGSTSSTPSAAVFTTADVTFLEGMYPHHAQAVQMATMVPARTTTPALLDLAKKIAAAQKPEMDTMTGLLKSFGRPAPTADPGAMGGMSGMDHGGGSSMAGMMSAQDMTTLGALSGAGFDRQWLTMMIDHHSGAIEQAGAELKDGSNPEARALATSIVSDQQAEITTMKGLLAA